LSVYTAVSERELAGWLKRYAVGEVRSFEAVAAGIENSNYFVSTSQGRYVLTLFERLPAHELPFYLDLMAHLARHGVPCPAPIADREDRFLSQLNGKPAALVTRLAGASLEYAGETQCAQLGALVAQLHLAGRTFRAHLDNPRGPKWWSGAARAVRPFLSREDAALLDAELRFQRRRRFAGLPRGPVHADLFRDNVLFEGGRISGVVDFYFAGVDCLLFDLAVCANDWCLVDPARDLRLDAARTRAMLAAYAARRPFEAIEREAWPVLLRAAALRFWLSRLLDFYLPRRGALVRVHDPEHFRTMLRLRAAGDAAPWIE
jgi:homoserine kinase type II